MQRPKFRNYSELLLVTRTTALMLLFGSAAAGQIELSMFAPWTAEGKVYKTGPVERQFVGVFQGVMFADDRKGELDTAPFVCPVVHLLNTESGKTEASARCHIVAPEGNIYGRFDCAGEPGWCRGRFEITAGSHEFEGIVGTGDIDIRLAIHTEMQDPVSGHVIEKAEGIAIWPNLVVNIPETNR